MRDRIHIACCHTGKGGAIGRGFAGIAFVFQFFLLVISDHGYRIISKRIIGVFIDHLEDIGRACGHTRLTAITFIGIDRNKKIARSILVSIICEHSYSLAPCGMVSLSVNFIMFVAINVFTTKYTKKHEDFLFFHIILRGLRDLRGYKKQSFSGSDSSGLGWIASFLPSFTLLTKGVPEKGCSGCPGNLGVPIGCHPLEADHGHQPIHDS